VKLEHKIKYFPFVFRPFLHQTKNMPYGRIKTKKHMIVISATVSEEVSHHIASINDSYSALKRLNDLHDTLRTGTHTIDGEALQPRVEE
jgi:hypothetical protein